MAAITRLGLSGHARSLYGSFAGKVESVVVAIAKARAGGRRGRKARPRRSFIDGQVYTVTPEEEVYLLREWRRRLDAEAAAAAAGSPTSAPIKIHARRVDKRIDKAQARAEAHRRRLEADDEDILAIYGAMS